MRAAAPSLAVRAGAGVRFPLLVFAVWRVLHGVVVLAWNGPVGQAAFEWDGG